MLKTILSKLNGHAAEPPPLAEALAQLGRDRSAAEAAIAEVHQRRRQALLDDADDKTLDKLERELDRATIHLEKLNIAEAPLRAQLASARAGQMAVALERHRARRIVTYKRVRSALEALASANAEAMQTAEAARAELGDGVAQRIPLVHFGGIPLPDTAAHWIKHMDGVMAGKRPIAAAPSPIPVRYYAEEGTRFMTTPPPPTPKPKTPNVGESTIVSSYNILAVPALEPFKSAPRAPDDTAPLQAGEVRARVLRNGYESGDGKQSHAGRLVRLRRDVALKAAETCAVTIIEEDAK
jgi:hypothetical protein